MGVCVYVEETLPHRLLPPMEDRQERQPLLDSQNRQDGQNQSNGKRNLVEFDPNGDEANPLEWTKKYRWIIVFFLSFMATTV